MNCSFRDMMFPSVQRTPVVAAFDGGAITSDAGLLLLAQADRNLQLSRRLAAQMSDVRDAGRVRHSTADLLKERVFAICAGYEDANDLDRLGSDPALLLSCDRRLGDPLASQPTLSRFENRARPRDLLGLSEVLAQIVVEQLPGDTKRIVLDVDATDDPCHGQQELECFNGYYDTHCYVPLYLHITGDDGIQRLMAAVLRPGNAGPKTGLFALLRRAIALVRKRFPKVKITVRADSAFGDGAVLSFCDAENLAYTLALRGNERLTQETVSLAEQVKADYATTRCDQTRFISFEYRARSWEHACRVVAKVETVFGKLNVRYVVTSRRAKRAEKVYAFYCERGDRENRIKEMKNDLGAGRTSCHRFLANQFRLILHTAACILWRAVQDALQGTQWANKQVGTLRLMLVKIGARITWSCRRFKISLPTSCPYAQLWYWLHKRIVPAPT